MSYQEQKLALLRQLRNPVHTTQTEIIQGLAKILEGVQMQKGDSGYTPVKGVDYFTAEELVAIIEHITEQVQSKVKDGDTPDDAKLAALIEEMIPDPVPGSAGDNGLTPRYGIDYFTQEDQDKIVQAVVAQFPKQTDGKKVKFEDIVQAAVAQVITEQSKKKIKFSDIEDIDDLVQLLKRGGFRGGGGSSSGGGGFTRLPATGLVNSVNLVYTFTSAPTYIVADGIWLEKTDSNGNIQWSIAGTTVTMINPPSTSIYGVA